MHCPGCLTPDTKVIDSRLLVEGNSVRRRRRCETCGRRFTTYERLIVQLPAVVKNDGRRESFGREKILKGLRKACQKRPLPMGEIDKLIESVEKALMDQPAKEIPSSAIGEMVMERLYRLDPVAYVRFASFYWNYDDIDSFVKGLQATRRSHSEERRPEQHQHEDGYEAKHEH